MFHKGFIICAVLSWNISSTCVVNVWNDDLWVKFKSTAVTLWCHYIELCNQSFRNHNDLFLSDLAYNFSYVEMFRNTIYIYMSSPCREARNVSNENYIYIPIVVGPIVLGNNL